MRYNFIKSQEKGYERLGEMELEESLRNFPDSLKISEGEFWDLINNSKRKCPSDFGKQMEFLTMSLANFDNDKIVGFERVLREKVIELWDYKIKSLYQIIDGEYISTDLFIYFRFWIISNGEEFYRAALHDTDNLSEYLPMQLGDTGERLMSVADNAFYLKNGRETKSTCPSDLSFDVDYDVGRYKMTGDYIHPKDFRTSFPKLTRKF